MRAAFIGLAILVANVGLVPARAEDFDEAMRIYAVNVIKMTPFRKPLTGFGVYLGHGAVLTAAHVVGRLPFLKSLHVRIGDQDLPARLIKQGSVDQIDLAVLAIDETQLPSRLKLRRNPVCKEHPRGGQDMVVAIPEKTEHTQIVPQASIPRELQGRYDSMIAELIGASGAGVFDPQSRCLMGIITSKLQKYRYIDKDGKKVAEPIGWAAYFVPASQITDFIPEEFRF